MKFLQQCFISEKFTVKGAFSLYWRTQQTQTQHLCYLKSVWLTTKMQKRIRYPKNRPTMKSKKKKKNTNTWNIWTEFHKNDTELGEKRKKSKWNEWMPFPEWNFSTKEENVFMHGNFMAALLGKAASSQQEHLRRLKAKHGTRKCNPNDLVIEIRRHWIHPSRHHTVMVLTRESTNYTTTWVKLLTLSMSSSGVLDWTEHCGSEFHCIARSLLSTCFLGNYSSGPRWLQERQSLIWAFMSRVKGLLLVLEWGQAPGKEWWQPLRSHVVVDLHPWTGIAPRGSVHRSGYDFVDRLRLCWQVLCYCWNCQAVLQQALLARCLWKTYNCGKLFQCLIISPGGLMV